MSATYEEVDPIIKQEPELDFTASDISSKPVIRKVRTLPACLLSSGFSSEPKSTSTTAPRVCESIKVEPYTVDDDESEISSTFMSLNDEIEFKSVVQIHQELHEMPEKHEADSFMEHTSPEVKPEADSIINYNSEVTSNQVGDDRFMTNGGSEIDDGMAPEILNSIANSPRDYSGEHNFALTSAVKQRSACRYGSSCYRVNPQHKVDFSHPGDADYGCDSASDQKVNVKKPDCRYGSRCYRKNEEHRQKFNHPAVSSSGRPKRTKTLHSDLHFEAGDSDSLEDFSDSDEYEVSFIDDSEDSFSDLDEDTDEEDSDFSDGSDASLNEDSKKRKQNKKNKGCKKKKFSLF